LKKAANELARKNEADFFSPPDPVPPSIPSTVDIDVVECMEIDDSYVVEYLLLEDDEEFAKQYLFEDDELKDIQEDSQDDLEDTMDEAQINQSLRSDLREWVYQHPGTTHKAVSTLLKILKRYIDGLPGTYATLMRTKTKEGQSKSKIVDLSKGRYAHIGLIDKIKNLTKKNVENVDILDLDIGIDGLSFFKSSPDEIWPVLGFFPNIPYKIKPFAIGVYYGPSHPNDVDEFLAQTADELSKLLSVGTVAADNKIKKINVRMFAVDAPARGFVTGTVGHSAKNGCNQCDQVAIYDKNLRKLVYSDEIKSLRTDDSFAERLDPLHHKQQYRDKNNKMVLERIENFGGIVSKTPIDPMHNVDLGVVRKILVCIHSKNVLKIPYSVRNQLSIDYANQAKFIPSEFGRQTRLLDLLKFWKAVEFRLFVMITGIVYFKQLGNQVAFEHFLLLHVAVRLLSNENLYLEKADFAQDLMQQFVKGYSNIYGLKNFTYNTHCLLHLAEGCKNFGPLYDYSCYKFENFLGEMKSYIRSPTNVLQQIVNQIDGRKKLPEDISSFNTRKILGLKKKCKEIFPGYDATFNEYQFDDFVISNKQNDNCCYLASKKFIIVLNISIRNGGLLVVGQELTGIEPFFTKPVNSLGLGIAQSTGLSSQIEEYPIEDISYKCVRLPLLADHPTSSVVIPMVHTM
jgi:hypothetical protein